MVGVARDLQFAGDGRLSRIAQVQGEERIDTLEGGDRDTNPEESAAASEAKEKFRRAFETLPQRDREVAILLYVKNLTLREVGEVLGVTESRVCQIHSQLKRELRSRLADDAVLFSEVA